MKGILSVLLVAAFTLAGCSSSSDGSKTFVDKPPIDANKGAIQGLLIDDIYRPIPGGKVLLTPDGLTAVTDNLGQFQFVNLAPKTYTLRVEVAGHEGAPATVDVVANEYADIELSARRIYSEGGRIDTIQYSVFLPCGVASPAVLGTVNCFGDLSGDTYRTSAGNLEFTNDTTALIFEVKAAKPGNYVLALRHDDGTPEGGEQYYNIVVSDGTYGKGILIRNEAADGFVVWKGDKPLEAAMFVGGQVQTSESGYGIGADFGVKAQILISAFIGPPEVNLDEYHLLAEE